MKKNNNNKKYSTGGDIAGVVQGLSPLLNLVMPGLGTGVGAVAGLAGGLMNKNEMNQQAQQNAIPTNYRNPSALGYQQGGPIDPKKTLPYSTDKFNYQAYAGKLAFDIPQSITNRFNRVGEPTLMTSSLFKDSASSLQNMYDSHQDKYVTRLENGKYRLMPDEYKEGLSKQKKYAEGGRLPFDSFEVNSGQGQVDGMDMNYKGNDIALDFGETVDVSKDRVMSNRIINPRTNNTFAQDDKKIKMNRAKNEKMVLANHTDPVGKFTNTIQNKMEDSLFSEQEMLKALEQSRIKQKNISSQMGAMEGFAMGGKMGYSDGGKMKRYYNDYEASNPIDPNGPGVPNGVPYNVLNPAPEFDSGYPRFQIGTPNNAELWDRASYEDAQAFDSIKGTPVPALNKAYDPNKLQFKSNNVTPLSTLMNQAPGANSTKEESKPGFLNQFTLGEKVAAGTGLASLGLKAAEVFQPLKKQNPYLNNGPISKMQLDPTQALFNQQQSYKTALSDSNNQTSSFAQRQAMAQGLFSNRLDAQNQVMTNYAGKNADMAQQYEERLGQRKRENNQALAQADQINEANRARRQNMRMGLYSDVATMGQNMADLFNAKRTEGITLATLKKLNPDVYENYMKELDLKNKINK